MATITAVLYEIRNNEKLRKDDLKREYQPYLYFIFERKDAEEGYDYVNIFNFGKYAACDIKGYIVDNEEKKLLWDQHFCLNGNSNYEISMIYPKDSNGYYIYEFKDVLGRTYSQKVICYKKNERTSCQLGMNFLLFNSSFTCKKGVQIRKIISFFLSARMSFGRMLHESSDSAACIAGIDRYTINRVG